MHQLLTGILTSLCLDMIPPAVSGKENISSLETFSSGWLPELKDLLENHYAEPFSLEMCEKLFGVSRYRLCREFSAAYGAPPLKYLTRIRLENAKKMLLTTDLNICEVSSHAGYDNVNHFIHLFKKETGATPGAFRRKVRAEQYGGRSPAR